MALFDFFNNKTNGNSTNSAVDVNDEQEDKQQPAMDETKDDEEKKKTLLERIFDRGGWLLKAMIPFAENLIAFIPFFMLNNRATDSKYFARLDFYVLYVLLFAIVYGQQQAVFSAVLATAGYCFRQMYNQSGFELMLDTNTYVWIAQIFILGLVVGYMRDQITKMKRESVEEKQFLSGVYRTSDRNCFLSAFSIPKRPGQAHTLFADLGQRFCYTVFYAEGYMMHTFVALVQPFLDGAFW